MSESKETDGLNNMTNRESSLQRYTSHDAVSVEMVGLTSRSSRMSMKPWTRTSYDVVNEASLNQKRVSVVEEDDDKEIREGGSMTTQRRVPQWCVCVILIVVSLLVAAVLITISVIPLVGIKATTKTPTIKTIVSTTTPTSSYTGGNTCLLGEFWCGTPADRSECIPVEWRCDGAVDCTTGRDETYCEDFTRSSTTIQPRPCVAWQQTFNESCERPSPTTQCEYIPQCQADGSRWTSIQCTMDQLTCWCVDQADGATIPGTFVGIDVLINGEIPNCL